MFSSKSVTKLEDLTVLIDVADENTEFKFMERRCSATAPVSYPAFIEEPPQ
jgi:hypothetical protein